MLEVFHLATVMAVWMAAAPIQPGSVQQNPAREQRWQRLTQSYLFTSGRLEHPRVGDPHIAQDVDSLRMEIARLTGADPETVRLVEVGFSADAKPDVSIDVFGDVKYRARFCRYDAMGTPHVDVDETFSSEGATIFIGRERDKEAFVLVARDHLAAETTNIVKIQRELDRELQVELEKAGGGQERPAIAPVMLFLECPRDVKE